MPRGESHRPLSCIGSNPRISQCLSRSPSGRGAARAPTGVTGRLRSWTNAYRECNARVSPALLGGLAADALDACHRLTRAEMISAMPMRSRRSGSTAICRVRPRYGTRWAGCMLADHSSGTCGCVFLYVQPTTGYLTASATVGIRCTTSTTGLHMRASHSFTQGVSVRGDACSCGTAGPATSY